MTYIVDLYTLTVNRCMYINTKKYINIDKNNIVIISLRNQKCDVRNNQGADGLEQKWSL